MADNRYEEQNNSQSSGFSTLATMGAVGAGIAVVAHPGLRRGALNSLEEAGGLAVRSSLKVASYLNRTTGIVEKTQNTMAYLKAMDRALDYRSPLSHMMNPQRAEQRFQETLHMEMDRLNTSRSRVLGSKPFEIENSYDQYMADLRSHSNDYFRESQRQVAVADLKRKMPQYFAQGQGLEGILTNIGDDFFQRPTMEKIRGMMGDYNGSTNPDIIHKLTVQSHDQNQFMSSMMETLRKYSDREALGRTAVKRGGGVIDNGVQVQGAASLADKIRQGFKDNNAVKQTWVTKMMGNAGFRVATNRDMLTQDASGKFVNKLFANESIIRQRNKDAQSFHRRVGDKLAALANRDSSILDLAVDHHLFVNDAGHFVDMRGMADGLNKAGDWFQQNFQLPYLRFNPLDLIHWTTRQAVKEAPKSYLLRRGTIHPTLQGQVETIGHPNVHNQDAAAGQLAKDYIYTGNNVYDLVSGKLIEEDAYLTSARFGMMPRALASMANLHHRDLSNRGPLATLFDIGRQEGEHIWNQMASTVTKFTDPNWARNRFRMLLNPNTGEEDLEASYKDLYAELNSRTKTLSDDAAGYLNRFIQQNGLYGATDIDLTKMRNPQEVMETLGRLSKGLSDNSGPIRNDLSSSIGEMWHQYLGNPQEFLKNKRIVSDNAPYMMGPLQAVDAHETTLVNKVDDVKRLIQQHAIDQIQQRSGVTVGDLIRQGISSGELKNEALEGARDLSVLTHMQRHWDDVYKNGPLDKQAALLTFQREVINDGGFQRSLADAVERHAPIWAMGPGQKPPQYFGFTGSTVVKKARGYQWWLKQTNEQIKQGYNPVASGIKSAIDVLAQPFAGRKNLQDVTTISMGGFYLGERLDNMAAKLGLGLSQANRGSMQSIIGNQFLRRIVLPYAAVQQFQYLNSLTNDYVGDKMADTYANMTMDVGAAKDITGINAMGKYFGSLMPGMDQFWSTPIGGALKYGTFGLLGDTRNAQELQDYYEHGEDPVRKGRWWGIGSNTPWEGGKIDRFEPNWYRQLKSHYKFTDTLYGSEDEYWANNWMPTLTHPLAPLRHFLLDPNHYADKHKDDRPYPVSGGIEELDMIPLVGPALNRTIGGILNPFRERGDLNKAHRQYQEDLNNYIKGQYDSALGSGSIQFMPAGGYQVLAEQNGFGGGFGEGLSALTAPGEEEGYGGYTGGKGGAAGASRAYLSALNLSMTGKSAGQAGGIMAPVRPISTLADLQDPDNYADLMDYTNTGSTSNAVGDTWYSLTEMAGIYGFSANMFAGVDTNRRSNALASAGQIGSYQRAWWDLEMGGLGGDLSELFRRYVPRDPRKQYYNPYRNTMPEWMPGLNYYMDFQHGDPYTKVAKGEMRLPGASYEKLNQLHPDQFGDYGAFDRFKILADVAPYSDEYKFWRRMVSQMNQQGMLNNKEVTEYQGVRDQVAQKKDKYHLYPYQFRNADITKETVHVTKVIDANTFLTAEHPDNPIRLANVHVKADATDVQEWLQQYIHEGAELKVGLDADPLFRVRDDTMNTMHAVVYSNGEDDNSFLQSTKGQSLNGMLARKKWEKPNSVTVKQENTAVGTAAMFDSADITVGKVNEWMVHSLLPNLPIAGPIFDKFLQVRSPLEMYKKNEVYGKSWKPWTDIWGSWVQPMVENAASKNPLIAAAQGYGIGWLAGKKLPGKYYAKWIGAAVFGTAAAFRSMDEFVGRNLPGGDDYAWLPSRRVKERAVNEYFDVLKYMKYKGLYERAKKEALDYEGVDLDKLIDDNKQRGDKNKRSKDYMAVEKKWLSISKNFGYVDDDAIEEKKAQVRERLNLIDADRPSYQIGPRAMQAMQYRLQYESTLYGADPNGDMTKIFRALPSKDREFFQQFMTANPEDREEILRLVPKNEKRFFQAKWGMKVDEKEGLSSYFMSHYLPGAGWEGWKPDVNLDDIKLKVVRNEGLDATEFGMWADDEARADSSGASPVPVFRPSTFVDVSRIQKVLEGSGLKDINVTMTTTAASQHGVSIGFDLLHEREEDIKQGLAENLSSIFG